jgi:hypothetical protein
LKNITRLTRTDSKGNVWCLVMTTLATEKPFYLTKNGDVQRWYPTYGLAKRAMMNEMAFSSHWARIEGGCL